MILYKMTFYDGETKTIVRQWERSTKAVSARVTEWKGKFPARHFLQSQKKIIPTIGKVNMQKWLNNQYLEDKEPC